MIAEVTEQSNLDPMGNCYAVVQEQDRLEIGANLRRIAIQRRMVAAKLGQAVIEARSPENRGRAPILLKKIRTLKSQHHALDSVETQLETISDINSTHSVISSVSNLFSVETHLPDIDEIGDVQDILADSQERCAEVDQALRDGFTGLQDPSDNMTSEEIQQELDVLLGLVDEPKPPPPGNSSLLEREMAPSRTTVKVQKKVTKTTAKTTAATMPNLVFPSPPSSSKPTSSQTDSTSPRASQRSGTPKEKQQQPTVQRRPLVLS